jgi:hypothetical protein
MCPNVSSTQTFGITMTVENNTDTILYTYEIRVCYMDKYTQQAHSANYNDKYKDQIFLMRQMERNKEL